MNTYVMPASGKLVAAELDYLSAVLDETTVPALLMAGVSAGWRCWDVSAGNGSIAAWLTDVVGAQGRVVATAADPRHVRDIPGATILGPYDVANAQPPDGGPFDLIHARLLLSGLPERKNVLHKLQRVLAPGGAVVVQDWGPWRSSQVLYAEGLAAGRVFDRFTMALDQVMTDRGTSARWAVEVHRHLRELGFVEVTTSVMARNWAGGTPGCLLLRALAQRLRAELLDVDLTAADLADVDGLLTDPAATIIGTPVWSTTAFRPCASADRGRR